LSRPDPNTEGLKRIHSITPQSGSGACQTPFAHAQRDTNTNNNTIPTSDTAEHANTQPCHSPELAKSRKWYHEAQQTILNHYHNQETATALAGAMGIDKLCHSLEWPKSGRWNHKAQQAILYQYRINNVLNKFRMDTHGPFKDVNLNLNEYYFTVLQKHLLTYTTTNLHTRQLIQDYQKDGYGDQQKGQGILPLAMQEPNNHTQCALTKKGYIDAFSTNQRNGWIEEIPIRNNPQ